MYASLTSVLLSKTGPLGTEFFRHVFQKRRGFVKPFVEKYPKLAAAWVGVPPEKRQQALSDDQVLSLLGQTELDELTVDLGLSREELVRMTDRALYQAVQMSSPDGLRVSSSEVARIDRDLLDAISGSQSNPISKNLTITR